MPTGGPLNVQHVLFLALKYELRYSFDMGIGIDCFVKFEDPETLYSVLNKYDPKYQIF
jgi:hypothetical protein